VFKDFVVRSTGRVVEVVVSGDLGYFWSIYNLTASPRRGGPAVQSRGKSIFIVSRLKDGSWKISRVIDNSDQSDDSDGSRKGEPGATERKPKATL
jgi:ketosteroid isomerase-like protein